MRELTVDATLENIEKVTDFINETLEGYGCSLKAQTQIDIAVDELFSNIVRYAYHPEIGSATVQIDQEDGSPYMVLTFKDSGKPYNPLEREDPDVTLSAEERGVGGLGIYLVKKSMDDVQYEYQDGQNILRIKKRITKS